MFLSSFVYPILYIISSCMLNLHEIKHYNYSNLWIYLIIWMSNLRICAS